MAGAPDSPSAILAELRSVLQSHGVADFALTGGLAVGVWAEPRHTRDIDVCGVLALDEVDRLLALRDGVREGSGELPDLVRFRIGDWDVDLFVAKAPYDRQCLERAVHATIDGSRIAVVTAEDLLIHKLRKLRSDRRRLFQDLADIRAICESQAGALDIAYLRHWLPPAEAAWLEAVTLLDDAALVQELFQVLGS